MKFHLCTYHFGRSAVGPHLYAREIAHFLVEKSKNVSVITEDLDPDFPHPQQFVSKDFKWPFSRINYIWRSFRYHRHIPDKENGEKRLIIYNNLFSAFATLLSKQKDDIVMAVSHDHYFTLDRDDRKIKEFILLHIYRSLEKYCLRKCDYVLFCSDYTQQRMETFYKVKRPSRFFRLYPGIDLSAFSYRDPIATIQSPVSVLFIKTNWEAGGLDLLIAGLNLISDRKFELTVAGPDPSEEEKILKLYPPGPNLNVKFVGQVDHKQIPGLMQANDLFCLPSRKEALGITLLEALACGTPVIASAVGGIPEALDNGRCGWMTKSLSSEGIADAILFCLSEDNLRIEKARLGRKHIDENFSVQEMHATLDKLFSLFTS